MPRSGKVWSLIIRGVRVDGTQRDALYSLSTRRNAMYSAMRVRSDRIRSKIILKNCKYFERRREEKNTPHRSRSYQSIIHDQLPYLPRTIYIHTHTFSFTLYGISHSLHRSWTRGIACSRLEKARKGVLEEDPRIGEEEDERSVRRSERLRARSPREACACAHTRALATSHAGDTREREEK